MLTIVANKLGKMFFENMIKHKKLIIKQVYGIENALNVKSGAIITCNHFNLCDNYVVYKAIKPALKKRHNLYKVIKEGNGVIPSDTSLVKVHYEGRLIDNEIIDSSYKRGEPTTFRVNQLIKGLTEALTHMPEGSLWEIYIPQDMAYGEREQGDIKPYSALIFKVELIKVNPKR